MDGHISKPIEAARLYALLQSVLDTEDESEDEPEAAAA